MTEYNQLPNEGPLYTLMGDIICVNDKTSEVFLTVEREGDRARTQLISAYSLDDDPKYTILDIRGNVLASMKAFYVPIRLLDDLDDE